MAQITVYAQSGITNWDSVDKWNTVAGGGGTSYTNPQNGGGDTFICDLNAKSMSLNIDVTVDVIQTASTSSALNVSTDRVITAELLMTGGSGSGMVRPSSGILTVNGVVRSTGAGSAIATSGSASLVLSNGTDVVVSAESTSASTCRTVTFGSSGSLEITGDVAVISGSGASVSAVGISSTTISSATINGNVLNNGGNGGGAALINYGSNSGSITINGNVTAVSGKGIYYSAGGGTLTINGDVVGSTTTTTNCSGVYVATSGADILVTGTIYGGTTTSYGIQWVANSIKTITITNALASATTPAVYLNATNVPDVVLLGTATATTGIPAIVFGHTNSIRSITNKGNLVYASDGTPPVTQWTAQSAVIYLAWLAGTTETITEQLPTGGSPTTRTLTTGGGGGGGAGGGSIFTSGIIKGHGAI